jgi:erythrocyte band 7 integral membrane protein
VVNPVFSVTKVSNSSIATASLAATTLRNILGTKTLQEVLQDKEQVAHQMQV